MAFYTVTPSINNYIQINTPTPNNMNYINPYLLVNNNNRYLNTPTYNYILPNYNNTNYGINHGLLNNNTLYYNINSFRNLNNTIKNIKTSNDIFPRDNIQINQNKRIVSYPTTTVKLLNNLNYPVDNLNLKPKTKTVFNNPLSYNLMNNQKIINNPQPNVLENNQNKILNIPNKNISANNIIENNQPNNGIVPKSIPRPSDQNKTLTNVKNNNKIINEPKPQNRLNSPKTNINNDNPKKNEDNKKISSPQNNTQEPNKQTVNQIKNINIKTLPNNIKKQDQKQIIINNNDKIHKDNINNNNNININEKQKILSGGVNKPNQNNINNLENNFKINNPNYAKVTKIDGEAPNTPAPVQNKPRKLTSDDLFNIIYLDIGIINLGNTCFINSCLQVLIHCPLFIHNFFRKMGSIKEKETPISHYLMKACVIMANTVITQQKYIDIAYLKNAFAAKHPQFEGSLQNDSQEFCRILLEDISTELNEIKSKPIYRTLTNTNRKTKRVRDLEFHQNFSEREKSIITELFYAQIITTYTCECKLAIYSFQKLLDFPLLLPDNCPQTTIDNLLKSYFQTEVIDFGIKCEKCGKILKHNKEIKISRPPTILILSLQRIDPATRKKNECFVSFPQVLDLSEYVDQELNSDKPKPIYTLFAVVNHAGNMDYGHYFSYIKLYNKQDWYEFNDSSVKNIGNKIESFPYAYALFYIKNENTKK